MADMMTFPATFEEFINQYEFIDNEEVYTNGNELIQSFRVMQAWDHFMDLFKKEYKQADGEMYNFGHACKRILQRMGEIE